MDFEQVMRITRTISSNTAFEDPECEAFYNVLSRLAPHSTIVEVGVEYGRSTSIILQVAKEKEHEVILVDPYKDTPEIWGAFINAMFRLRLTNFTFRKLRTEDVPDWPESIDLVHIDGNHTEQGVATDVRILVPRVPVGGFVCAHDFGRDSLPEVYKVLHPFFDGHPETWEPVPSAGTLGIWRRIA